MAESRMQTGLESGPSLFDHQSLMFCCFDFVLGDRAIPILRRPPVAPAGCAARAWVARFGNRCGRCAACSSNDLQNRPSHTAPLTADTFPDRGALAADPRAASFGTVLSPSSISYFVTSSVILLWAASGMPAKIRGLSCRRGRAAHIPLPDRVTESGIAVWPMHDHAR